MHLITHDNRNVIGTFCEMLNSESTIMTFTPNFALSALKET